MMNLSQVAERVGLMSGTPLYLSSILGSKNEPNKQREALWPNQPELRFPKMDNREASPYCSGWDKGRTNEALQELIGRVKGPFTPLQWMELEHQALIYKYINAKAPVPSSLLASICRSLLNPTMARSLGNNRVGWGNFQLAGLPLSSGDLEPGRCRRTDGKKWRCAKSAMPEHKYCERHLVRSRHRSRKPVEKQLEPANLGGKPDRVGKVETSVSRSSAALLGRPYPSKEKTSIKSLNLDKSTPNAVNTNELLKIPSKMSTFSPIASNTMLNFSGSSYQKNNSYMSSTSVGLSSSESPPHHLVDFIGELTKITPELSHSDPTQIDLRGSPGSESSLHVSGVTSADGPLGEILGNSNHDKTNQTSKTCYSNPFINGLEWSLS
ncbi:growth-regulating factor 1 [Rhynchospora pubera]|uniref:Growth-regulating factor n=1 Tax=Rhynchospora pubera TaxID=906938 RepID=A0AAV8ERH2_9POAL|nr:growth-regulating factor 1 [Rhynchospora pubera]